MISARTSRQMREMMRQVVVRGTARAADVEGYEVGGKTGTADKPNAHGGYARDKTISTFASFFPASAPKYVLVILLDEPTADHQQDRLPHRRADRGAGARPCDPAARADHGDAAARRRRRTARRCFTRSPETNSRRAGGRPGAEVTMAGTDRTDKLTGFEALGLLTGTRRAGDWSGPLPEITGLSVDSRESRPGTCSRRCPGPGCTARSSSPTRCGWAPSRC